MLEPLSEAIRKLLQERFGRKAGRLTEAVDRCGNSEEDLVGLFQGMPHHTRFLDYFSKVGVELVLERFGILQQLRARGFKTPSVHLELDHPLGQTVRIFGDDERRELLVEMRVRRTTREW